MATGWALAVVAWTLLAAGPAIRLPAPSLAGLEGAVVEQLEALEEIVETEIAAPGVPPERLAEAVGELGLHYQAYGLLEPAAACYRIAHGLAPADFRWRYLPGYLAQQQGRLQEAAERYEAALTVAPAAGPARFRLGEVYRDLGRTDEAAAAFERVLEGDPACAAAEAALGGMALAAGEAGAAVARYEHALELAPEANLLYYPLAQAHRALGELERARELLEQIGRVGVRIADPLIDSVPHLVTGERVHRLRGQAAYRAERYSEAAESYARAVEAAPSSAAPRVDLAAALARLGHTGEAENQLREALRLAPGNATAQFNLGRLLDFEGRVDEAAAFYEAAAELAPDDAECQFHWARMLAGQGRPAQALERYRRVIELVPAAELARLGEARALEVLGRQAEAMERLEAAHRLLPASGLVAEALAWQLATSPILALRDGARAVDLARRVGEAQPSPARVELLALALAEAGRCEEAAARLEILLDEAPPELWSDLDRRLRQARAGPPCRP